MNRHIIVSQLGLLFVLLSAIMLATSALQFLADVIQGQAIDASAVGALFITGVAGLLVGGIAWQTHRRGSTFLGRKEALLLVAASWFGGAFIAAFPYWLWAWLHFARGDAHPFLSFVSCYFEAMSGLTTTGATVLTNIEALPPSLLLWRALTHWLGGLGIVVLFVAVLPGLGVGGKRLFQIESPGPSPEGLQPHIRETARWLWFIYLGLTSAQILALWALSPMDLYESICHTMATLATGGFSTMNASVGAYHGTLATDLIVVFFMLLAGINFGLYYRICKGNVRALFRDTELRVYLGLIALSTIVIASVLALSPDPIVLTTGERAESTVGESVRQGLFTAVAIQTTTGFCTSDFSYWPFVAKAILIGLMFVGGSSGSTAGGIKIIRIWIAFKVLASEIEQVFRPHIVRPVRVGRTAVDPEMKLGAVTYVLGMLVLAAAGSVALMVLEQVFAPEGRCDFTTAATACFATLFNVGPGLAHVGPVEHYGWFSATSKALMCLLMALGRLEVFAIIVLFNRRFWQRL